MDYDVYMVQAHKKYPTLLVKPLANITASTEQKMTLKRTSQSLVNLNLGSKLEKILYVLMVIPIASLVVSVVYQMSLALTKVLPHMKYGVELTLKFSQLLPT